MAKAEIIKVQLERLAILQTQMNYAGFSIRMKPLIWSGIDFDIVDYDGVKVLEACHFPATEYAYGNPHFGNLFTIVKTAVLESIDPEITRRHQERAAKQLKRKKERMVAQGE